MPVPVRTNRRGTSTTISLEGPFFAHDPGKTFRQNIRVMMAAMAAEGESDVRAQMPSRTGTSRSVVRGRVKSLRGRAWEMTAHISSAPDDHEARRAYPWAVSKHRAGIRGGRGERGFMGRPQAIYRGGKLEAKFHMFRKTKNRLARSRRINMAELLKGIA